MRFGQQEQLTIAGGSSTYRTASVALVQLFETIGAGDGTQLGQQAVGHPHRHQRRRLFLAAPHQKGSV